MLRRAWPGLILLAAILLSAPSPAPAEPEFAPLNRAMDRLNRLHALAKAGRQAEALPLAEEILPILEAELGPDSPDMASVLAITAGLHDALEHYAKALPLYERALAIKEKRLGPNHPEVATLLGNLAWDIDALGDAAKALPLYERALAIREATEGPDAPATALAMNNLALCRHTLGDHAQALVLYERALAVNEKATGPESPETANSLNNLADTLSSLARYQEARPLFERALAIQEKVLGPDNNTLAMTVNNLAQLDQALGEFEAARGMLERSLLIREKHLGPHHPDTALARNNLAGLLGALGEYDQARPLYEQSLADLEQALGPEHPSVAACLDNLASTLSSLGDPEAARPLFSRSLAIWEKLRGPEGEDVARPLNNLALLHYARGEYDQARSLLERARAILEKSLGPEHPLVANAINALAGVAQAQGNLDLSKQLNERALAIREKILGPDHLETAISLNNLAGDYVDLGQRREAVALYERALAIMERVLGPRHPYTSRVLNNLARVEAADGHLDRAFTLMRRAQAIDAASIEPIMAVTSDTQKLKYLATLEATLHDFQSLVATTALREKPQARLAAFETWLGRKGVVLEAQRRFQEALFLAADPETSRLARELAEARGQISRLTFAGPGLVPPETLRERLAELDRRKEALETALSARAGRFSREKKRAAASPAELAAALPQGSVLVELCRCEVSDFTAKKRKTGRWRYLAYVLAPGPGKQVDLVDLGDAEALDGAIAACKASLKDATDRDGARAIAAGRALHDRLFAPLRPAIGQARTVFISPDGEASCIPLEVLVGPDGRYLVEDFAFNYLAAGRDMLGFAKDGAGSGPIVLFGDPDFNRPATAAVPSDQDQGAVSRAAASLRFSPLPGTREEVTALAGLLGPQAVAYLEGRADEAALAQVAAPRILHLATHGFFLSDQKLSLLLGPGDDRSPGAADEAAKGPSVQERFENPLLRSGLALAGANAALAASDGHGGRGGLVTAEKVLGLNLHGTRLVVLSACETGLGQVKAGEGVFGLRRAFAQAGARGLVMSMWSVPDKETKELMVGLYRYLRQGDVGPGQALRRAALDEMAVVRQRYGQPRPFFWGAFVFLGQP
jgi:CHAT domain-containing protein/tetratricopeptide (TPR) repeat protein